MPIISDITIIEQPKMHVLSVRTTAQWDDISIAIGYAFASITAYLREMKRYPAGGPFISFYNDDPDELDIEMGVPLASPCASKGDMVCRATPVQKMASALFLGDFAEVEELHRVLLRWTADNGWKTAGRCVYHYLNDETRPHSEQLVRLLMPVVAP